MKGVLIIKTLRQIHFVRKVFKGLFHMNSRSAAITGPILELPDTKVSVVSSAPKSPVLGENLTVVTAGAIQAASMVSLEDETEDEEDDGLVLFVDNSYDEQYLEQRRSDLLSDDADEDDDQGLSFGTTDEDHSSRGVASCVTDFLRDDMSTNYSFDVQSDADFEVDDDD